MIGGPCLNEQQCSFVSLVELGEAQLVWGEFGYDLGLVGDLGFISGNSLLKLADCVIALVRCSQELGIVFELHPGVVGGIILLDWWP